MRVSYRQNIKTLSRDNDFPRTFSWLTSLDTTENHLSSPLQTIPNDIIEITSTLADVFDRTTLDIDFDHSCMDGLDHQTLYTPHDSFATICWAEAVDEPSHLFPGYTVPREHVGDSSDESESEYSEECDTLNEDFISLLSPHNHDDLFDDHEKVAFPELTESPISDLLFEQFLVLEPRPTILHLNESIGHFPIPNSPYKTKKSRIASLRAYLPQIRPKKATQRA